MGKRNKNKVFYAEQMKKDKIEPEKLSFKRKMLIFISFLLIGAGFYCLALIKTDINSFYGNVAIIFLFFGYTLPIFALKQ